MTAELRIGTSSFTVPDGVEPRGNSGLAKVAIARKLAVRLYWKLRAAAQPVPPAHMQGSPTVTVAGESLSSY